MSLKRITGKDGSFISNLTCCNRKVYALNNTYLGCIVIQLNILVKEKEVVIKFMPLGEYPSHSLTFCDTVTYFLKGHGTELFCINVGFCKKRIEAVYFFKLNMASVKSEDMVERFKSLDMSCERWDGVENMAAIFHNSMRLWEQLFDLKDAIFFVDLGGDKLAYYRPGIASEMGGYIHIRDEIYDILYSYNVKENTIFLSSMPSLELPTSNVSLWECRYFS